jgi:hypothetical protein
MARTAKALTLLANDAGVDSAAGYTAVDVANGIAVTGAGNKDADKLVLVFKNTAGAAKVFTVKCGSVDPWRQHKGVGDLAVSVPAGGERAVALGDGARYRQADDALWIDFEAATTGTVGAFLLP